MVIVQLKKVQSSPSLFIENVSLDEYLSLLGFKQLNNFVFKPNLDLATVKVLKSLGYELEDRLQKKLDVEIRKDFGEFKTEMLLPYQKEVLEFAINNNNVILALDMGLGKSMISLGYTEHFKENKTLILCPSRIKHQWKNEIGKFTEVNLNKVSVIDGTPKQRKQLWEDNSLYKIASYDILKIKQDFNLAKNYINNGNLILDEVTYCKNENSGRSIQVQKIREVSKRVIGATGTPLTRDLSDFKAIINLVEPNLIDKNYFDELLLIKEKRFVGRGREIELIIGSKKYNIPVLLNVIQPIFYPLKKEEVLTLPPTSTVSISVEFDSVQKQIESILIDLSKEDFRNNILLNDGSSGLRWLTFLRENLLDPSIVNYELFEDEPRCEKLIELIKNYKSPSPRIKAALELIKETDNEIILYSDSVKGLNLIEKFIKDEKVSKVTGSENTLEEFLNNNSRILLLSSSASHGLNLQQCNKMIIFSNSWNYSTMEQLRNRIYRYGQERHVTYYELENFDSVIEQRVKDLINEKKDLTSSIIEKRLIGELIDDKQKYKTRPIK